jgi:hypothetical protein
MLELKLKAIKMAMDLYPTASILELKSIADKFYKSLANDLLSFAKKMIIIDRHNLPIRLTAQQLYSLKQYSIVSELYIRSPRQTGLSTLLSIIALYEAAINGKNVLITTADSNQLNYTFDQIYKFTI